MLQLWKEDGGRRLILCIQEPSGFAALICVFPHHLLLLPARVLSRH